MSASDEPRSSAPAEENVSAESQGRCAPNQSPEAPAEPVNKQLYANSPLRHLAVELLGPEPEGSGLFNDRDPNLAILHEKPEHRLIVWLKAEGKSNREVAHLTGYTEAWISQVLRQPWARRYLVEQLNKAGRDELQTILAGAAADSLHTLIELRDSAEQESVRKAAADSLLDRFMGKPTQRVETQQSVTVTAQSIEEVDKELERLDAEEKRLVGRN